MKTPKTIEFQRWKSSFISWQSVLSQSVVCTQSRNSSQQAKIFSRLR